MNLQSVRSSVEVEARFTEYGPYVYDVVLSLMFSFFAQMRQSIRSKEALFEEKPLYEWREKYWTEEGKAFLESVINSGRLIMSLHCF